MKYAFLALVFSIGLNPIANAQPMHVYRCGNEYTNNDADAAKRGCLLMEAKTVSPEGKPSPALVAKPFIVPISPDGHFHMSGTVNGEPAEFMVDTGASMVSVSSAFAGRAGLQGGKPAAFRTANGVIQGRVISGVNVQAGSMLVTGVEVVVGPGDDRLVLLGQSFLHYFEITMDARQMVMRYKGR